jgi:hypothetical protein
MLSLPDCFREVLTENNYQGKNNEEEISCHRSVFETMDEINRLTGKLGNIRGINVKTSISKKDFDS